MMDFLKISQKKIIKPEFLKSLLAYWRFTDQTIVFTNGCFDILHLGHIDYLARARNLGSKLIIGLNTDDSVKRLKGENRPVNNEYARAMVLASLSFVDAIAMFDEDTPYDLIKIVLPDILVKGSDYKPEDIVGGEVVKNNGGSLQTIDFLEGYSTTSIIQKLSGC